jgi:GNAT superfamily N-acetyltransferase
MLFRVDATPEELEEKAPELVKALSRLVSGVDPELADALEKALPEKEPELKFKVLQSLQKDTEKLYDKQMGLMIEEIIGVLGSDTKKSLGGGALVKSGPFVGPRGGKWADAAHTIPWHEDSGGKGHLQKLKEHLSEKYGISLQLGSRGSQIELSKIVVPKESRNEGTGTKAMKTIIAFADMHGKTVTLTPSTDFGGTKGKLVKFYKRLGFVENKGRNKDFEISEAMYREPKVQKSESPDYSEKIVAKEERSYEKVKEELAFYGYSENDYEPGGSLHGMSVNELIDLAKEKRG